MSATLRRANWSFKGKFDKNLTYDINDIVIKDNKTYIYRNNYWIEIAAPVGGGYAELYYNRQEPKHFNCKCCGAPNQINVCEYCGSAYE